MRPRMNSHTPSSGWIFDGVFVGRIWIVTHVTFLICPLKLKSLLYFLSILFSCSSHHHRPIPAICTELREDITHANLGDTRVEHSAPVSFLDAPLVHGILRKSNRKDFQ